MTLRQTFRHLLTRSQSRCSRRLSRRWTPSCALERLEERQLLSGVTFAAIDTVSTTGQPVSVAAIGDYNGDRLADLAYATGDRVTIRWGDPGGHFAGSHSITTPDGRDVVALISADLTGDGSDELLVKTPRSIDILQVSSDAIPELSFEAHIGIRKGRQTPTAVVDFSNDGLPDIVTGSFRKSDGRAVVRFVRNEGSLNLRRKTALTVGAARLRDAQLFGADVTANGRTDVVLVTASGNGKLFRSTQRGIRKNSGLEFTGADQSLIADLNNDARPDYVTRDASHLSNRTRLRVHLGKQDGGFQSRSIDLTLETRRTSHLYTADANGDGTVDVFTRRRIGTRQELIYASGDGSGQLEFETSFTFNTRTGPAADPTIVASGDLTGDGRADLIVRDGATGEAVIMVAQPKVGIDLRVKSVEIDPTVYVSDVRSDLLGNGYSPVDVRFAVENDGTVDAGYFATTFYLSTDRDIDPAEDRAVGTFRHLLGLDAGQTHETTLTVRFPPIADSYWAGEGLTYYLGAVVDPTNRIAEVSETNNSNQGHGVDIAATKVRHTYHGPQIKRSFDGVENTANHVTYSYTISNIGADGNLELSVDNIAFDDDGILHRDWEAFLSTGHSASIAPDQSVTLQIRVWKVLGDGRTEIRPSSEVLITTNALNRNPLKLDIDASIYF